MFVVCGCCAFCVWFDFGVQGLCCVLFDGVRLVVCDLEFACCFCLSFVCCWMFGLPLGLLLRFLMVGC